MYIPRHFKIDDPSIAHALIRQHNFALLINCADRELSASHLPFLLDSERGTKGALFAHMSRANPQWRSFESNPSVMVVFQGPHSYISPAWYRDQVTVPTWNYAAAHVYGQLKFIDGDRLAVELRRLIAYHEAGIGDPWDVRQMDAVFDQDIKGVVGFEIDIERIECAFKFNQNLSAEDQQSVIRALSASPSPDDQAVVKIMRQNLESKTGSV